MNLKEREYFVFYEWADNGYRYRAEYSEDYSLSYAKAFAELAHGKPVAFAWVSVNRSGEVQIHSIHGSIFNHGGAMVPSHGLSEESIISAAQALWQEDVKRLAWEAEQEAKSMEPMPW